MHSIIARYNDMFIAIQNLALFKRNRLILILLTFAKTNNSQYTSTTQN